MLLHVPVSLDGLLSLLASCFTQPTFQTFRALLVGQVSQTGPRTVCGMLVGARLSGVWEHSRAHRFFSHARWSPHAGSRVPVGASVLMTWRWRFPTALAGHQTQFVALRSNHNSSIRSTQTMVP